MEDYKVKQIWPAHADHISYYNKKFLEQMFNESEVIAQPKYDGERMLVHFNGDEVYCTSRRHSKKTDRFMENQDKIKDLPKIGYYRPFGYTVIDCEFYSDTWADAVGILHSLPERAYQLQETTNVHFAVFDCLWFDGKDMTNQPYELRYSLAIIVVSFLLDERFHVVPFKTVHSYEESMNLMNEAIEKGFEGIVVKSLAKKYYDKGAMLKCKKFETVDVVVYDYQQGNGKYADTFGALKIGYYEDGKIHHVSKVNCSTDEERNYWRDNWSTLQYSVIEVKCQEITDTSLRHPVYIRRRPDKSKEMCTKETIFK